MTGGTAALAAVYILGPRIGRFVDGKPTKNIVSHSIPLVTLGTACVNFAHFLLSKNYVGTLILFVGFFSFNGGSELTLGDAFVPNTSGTTMSLVSKHTLCFKEDIEIRILNIFKPLFSPKRTS